MEEQNKPISIEKLISRIKDASDSTALELIGKEVSLEELIPLCEILHEEYRDKMPAILVGLPHELFVSLLEASNEACTNTLKTIAATEPLQHHLTTLSHEQAHQVAQSEQALDNLLTEISLLETSQLGSLDIDQIYYKINSLAKKLKQLTLLTGKILAIAWNTSRLDLIETFSHTKERAEILISRGIGHQGGGGEVSSGVYAALDERLFAVYYEGGALEEAKDDEPAVEAMAKLSIWYPKDYWELGLLPQYNSLDENSLQRIEDSAYILQTACQNLKRFGLETLKDMKQARIFSKKSLKEYISRHRDKQNEHHRH